MPPAAADRWPASPGTVVSLTFDDGWKSQVEAAEAMTEREMVGTFFITSGQVGYPAFMTVRELRLVQEAGHEIGGHTLTHPRLTEMSLADAKTQVCSDRAGLLELGLRVTSFAYPYGDLNPAVAGLPKECGYNSARAGWGLYPGPTPCYDACLDAAEVKLYDRWKVRSLNPAAVVGKRALPRLKAAVLQAEATGGWLPMVFHHICAPKCKDPGIKLSDLEKFLDWLDERRPTTMVRSMDQVVSGAVRPPVGAPPFQIGGVVTTRSSRPPAMVSSQQRKRILAQGEAREAARVRAEDFTSNTAFKVPGFSVGQLEVIVFSLGAALVGVLVYRITTRRRRYEW